MNWEDSHLAAQAFSKSRGDMSLGDQWALASIMRDGDSGAGHVDAKPAKKKRFVISLRPIQYLEELLQA